MLLVRGFIVIVDQFLWGVGEVERKLGGPGGVGVRA